MSQDALHGYYKLHAQIYDLTRPFFLFGRRQLVQKAHQLIQPKRVLEIGCGTGWLLGECARLDPSMALTGIDLSVDMLKRARARLGERATLIHELYSRPVSSGQFDLVILSYMLTMTGAHFSDILHTAARDLRPNGAIAIVDFDYTAHPLFASWMRVNHVAMTGQIKREIDARFQPLWLEQRACYFGLWQRLGALVRPV